MNISVFYDSKNSLFSPLDLFFKKSISFTSVNYILFFLKKQVKMNDILNLRLDKSWLFGYITK